MSFLDFNGLNYFYQNKVKPYLNKANNMYFLPTTNTQVGVVDRDTIIARYLEATKTCTYIINPAQVREGCRITLIGIKATKQNDLKFSVDTTDQSLSLGYGVLGTAPIGAYVVEVIKIGGKLVHIGNSQNLDPVPIIPDPPTIPPTTIEYRDVDINTAKLENINQDILIFKRMKTTTPQTRHYNSIVAGNNNKEGCRAIVKVHNIHNAALSLSYFDTYEKIQNSSFVLVKTNKSISVPADKFFVVEYVLFKNNWTIVNEQLLS